MDKEEFLQEFIDFLKGIECLEFCHESNDPESDQRFGLTWKTDQALIASFMNSRKPTEADLRAKLSEARERLGLVENGNEDEDTVLMCLCAASDAERNLKEFLKSQGGG